MVTGKSQPLPFRAPVFSITSGAELWLGAAVTGRGPESPRGVNCRPLFPVQREHSREVGAAASSTQPQLRSPECGACSSRSPAWSQTLLLIGRDVVTQQHCPKGTGEALPDTPDPHSVTLCSSKLSPSPLLLRALPAAHGLPVTEEISASVLEGTRTTPGDGT